MKQEVLSVEKEEEEPEEKVGAGSRRALCRAEAHRPPHPRSISPSRTKKRRG